MSVTNQKLSQIFQDMSSIYQYLGGEERFRTMAYRKAAKVIGSLAEDVSEYIGNNTLKDLPGIGDSTSEKIIEFVKTGKIKKFEQLKKTVPFELLELTNISGFGPQSLKQIHVELKISDKEKLIRALEDGSIAGLKGFGPKKVENMLRGLKIYKTIENRMVLWDALEAGDNILKWMKKCKEVKQVELAGSLRRRKETIGDIDLLVACDEKNRKKIITHFLSPELVQQTLAKGDTKASIILKSSGKQVDLRIVNEEEWGAALQYFTGSKEHNIHLRSIAKARGYKISEYGIFTIEGDKKIEGVTEEDIYHTLGYEIMPPEMREDKGEIALSAKHKIPKLVSVEDIKGDLHMHSVSSDGINSIEEILKYIKSNMNYEYIAITDHSKSSRIAHGMDEKQLIKQIRAIEQLNKKYGNDFIKKGVEVDILPDGKLDISNEILAQLDWVTAAIHSGFGKDNTDRLIRACENKYVCCIGHPSGRLIGKREPYQFNLNELLKAALTTGTALEINCQPFRMDLNDESAWLAREKGVKLVISTDSHDLQNFNFMNLGVFIARRAWCEPSDILNTLNWAEISKWINKKRSVN